ncbi:MAG TPA: lipid-A-disaccharide synthase [Verrucomicrobiae bacterium]|nr:lipid-A-disaccharide synthase [Verrucomicrobiae bacterium]
MTTQTIMFVVGEASADAHAAVLIRELRRQSPDVQLFGAGGPKMRDAGMELRLDLTEHAVVGLVEVLKSYRKFRRIFNDLLAEVARRRPGAVVLVDFPGFNLRLATAVKQRHPQTKVIYYISPQLWAWHGSRAKQIERDIDLMVTIFPFEKDWYARHAPKLRVEFVGHPMIDQLREATDLSGCHPERSEGSLSKTPEILRSAHNDKREDNLVLLLPGSREREVAKIWPILAKVVDEMPGNVEFVAAAVNEQTAAMMRHPRVRVEVGMAQAWMRRAALAITASGTATMECAFHGCPMIVVYKVAGLTYLVGRMVVTVNWLAMPNVIAGREIVPEFIQYDARPGRIAGAARQLLENSAKREAMQRDLAAVVGPLGGPGASDRAARVILDLLTAKSAKDTKSL